MHLRRKCILLLSDGMPYKYQLSSSGLMCHLRLMFSYCLSVRVFCPLVYVNFPGCYCVTIDFLFYGFQYLSYILRCFYVECIYIYNCFIFFLDLSLDHFVVSFLVSYKSHYLKYILSDISIVTPAFFSFPFAWDIFLHSFTFSLCVS